MISPPTTLEEFADNQLEARTSSQTAAQKALTAAQLELAAAQAQAAKDAAALDAADQAVRAARAKVASATLPADVTKAADDLEQALATLHDAQGAALADEQRSDEARRSAAAAAAQSERAAADLVLAKAAQKDAKAAGDAEQQWITAVGTPPLSKLDTQATTYLASKPYTDAGKRIATDFPAELRTRADDRLDRTLKRRKREQALATTAQTKLDEDLAANAGNAGAVAAAWTAYRTALAELKELALLGQERLDRAKALIDGINAAAPLTDAESKRIKRTDIVNAGKTGATDELARDNARDAVADKLLEIEQARVAVVAKTPDAADPDADTTVKTLIDALPGLQTTLGTAETKLEGTRPGLSIWEATVPDSSWQLLADFNEATFILKALERKNPPTTPIADLAKNVTDAEAKLAGALQTQAEHGRAQSYLQARLSVQRDRIAEVERLETRITASALRGDQV